MVTSILIFSDCHYCLSFTWKLIQTVIWDLRFVISEIVMRKLCFKRQTVLLQCKFKIKCKFDKNVKQNKWNIKFFKQHYFVLIDFQSLYSKSVLIFVTSSFPEIGCSVRIWKILKNDLFFQSVLSIFLGLLLK